MLKSSARVGLLILINLFLCSCTTPQPRNIENVCTIFYQYPNWYWASLAAERRWGIPVPLQMAIMRQESSFRQRIKPPREHIFGVVPWVRPSSAYGYSQALNNTWKVYIRHTGRLRASRHNFIDCTDFISWYGNRAHQLAGVPKYDAYSLYLAYHEGIGGYIRGSYLRKPWLVRVARIVQRRANRYAVQLNHCAPALQKHAWWRSW